jgi:prepilin-type N-terminal cleavage/methylation domain-containing protein/prepilin-type processing-associated H-X9-DG protein
MLSHWSASRRRYGFSLIELLTTIAVVAVALILVLPALLVARAAAAKTQCKNSLGQLGLGLQHYLSTTNVLPASYGVQTTDGTQSETWGSWSPQSKLLPYLEAAQIYNSLNFNFISNGGGGDEGDLVQATAVATRIKVFLCPASRLPEGQYYGRPTPGNSYFASVGPSLNWVGADGPGAPSGAFRYGGGADPAKRSPPLSIADFQDGTSTTIAFGEWLIGDLDARRLTVPQDVVNLRRYPPGLAADNPRDPRLNIPAGARPFKVWITECAGFAPTSIQGGEPWLTNLGHLGRSWNQGMLGWTLGNTLLPPNPPYPNCIACIIHGDFECPGVFGLSSGHPDGCNVAMVDGSVRFLKSTANQTVVWALGTRADGDVIGPD